MAASQVELSGEDDGDTFLVGVAIDERGRGRSLEAARREFVPGNFRVRCDSLQAALAETARLRQVSQEAMERGTGKRKAFTPARSLVGFAGFHPAAVWLVANRVMTNMRADLQSRTLADASIHRAPIRLSATRRQ